jgi:hypothetical protein
VQLEDTISKKKQMRAEIPQRNISTPDKIQKLLETTKPKSLEESAKANIIFKKFEDSAQQSPNLYAPIDIGDNLRNVATKPIKPISKIKGEDKSLVNSAQNNIVDLSDRKQAAISNDVKDLGIEDSIKIKGASTRKNPATPEKLEETLTETKRNLAELQTDTDDLTNLIMSNCATELKKEEGNEKPKYSKPHLSKNFKKTKNEEEAKKPKDSKPKLKAALSEKEVEEKNVYSNYIFNFKR